MSTVEEEPKELIQDIAEKSVGGVLPNEILNASTTEEETKRAKIEWKTTSWENNPLSFPLDVTVSWLDYRRFKNRYSVEEGLAIIEVLKGHQNIEKEISQEMLRRQSQPSPRLKPSIFKQDGETWIQRVRIQSPQLLLLLSRLIGRRDSWIEDIPIGPRVFFRPFIVLYYSLPQMKECLTILEERWSKVDLQEDEHRTVSGQSEPDIEDNDSEHPDSFHPRTPQEAVSGPVADSVLALRHVRKYVEFLEAEIVPLWKRGAGTMHRKVQFLDLCMIFQPGELIYVPSDSERAPPDPDEQESVRITQKVWRIHRIERDMSIWPYQWDTSYHTKTYPKQFDLLCYFIDFDGVTYLPFPRRFRITGYNGLKDITSLPVYPLRFLKNAENLMAAQTKQGELFQIATGPEKLLYYEGWTLTHEPVEDPQLAEQTNPEYVKGQVMIDFAEGNKRDSSLAKSPEQPLSSGDNYYQRWFDRYDHVDEQPIFYWDSNNPPERVSAVRDNVQLVDDISDRGFETNSFLRKFKAGKATQIEPEDLILLPSRVVAYAFRERKFFRLDVNGLKPLPRSENVFKNLHIDETYKEMVQALVKAHFQKQKLDLDLIRGKGTGLVILLHGVPGVGKTATAEAVAQANRKPLFAITCGDIGFEPEQVENNLNDIFHLAHRWDCILLLDEADIFLARRDLDNLLRNSLVSVFLRVLEYYSGVLFLTTNRVGILDDAFKSRIHLSLYYPRLSKDQTVKIFRTNIRKLQEAEKERREQHAAHRLQIEINGQSILNFARTYFDNHEDHRWNGRQIRNAFQIAYSFSQFDTKTESQETWDEHTEQEEPLEAGSDGQKPGVSPLKIRELSSEQFKLVAHSVRKFNDYLLETLGETEAQYASTYNLRADHYDPDAWGDDPVYKPRSHRFQQQKYTGKPTGSSRGRGQPLGGLSMLETVQGRIRSREPSLRRENKPPRNNSISRQAGDRAMKQNVSGQQRRVQSSPLAAHRRNARGVPKVRGDYNRSRRDVPSDDVYQPRYPEEFGEHEEPESFEEEEVDEAHDEYEFEDTIDTYDEEYDDND